jgi:2-polyprenyl-3-methyl-5-hydroxy-6-metoxy-1,4-benzoquinol methylase
MKQQEAHFQHLHACPVCSAAAISPYKKSTFDYRSLTIDHLSLTNAEYGSIWDLNRCRECRHVFANPSPSPELVTSLYRETEDPRYEDEALGRSKNFYRTLSFLERLHPPTGTLFDVGAATGLLMDVARLRGWSVEGIEASSWAVRTARRARGIDIRKGTFETFRLVKNNYSAVTMIDFIEHTPRPLAAMIKAHAILEPDGILCVVTPDVESMAVRIMGVKWWHFRPAHLGYFSENSLATLLSRTGFSIVAKRKYTWNFSAHYILSRFKILGPVCDNPTAASILKKIPVVLPLRDSIEIYAQARK